VSKGQVAWTSGSVDFDVSSAKVTSSMALTPQTYQVFDHLTVAISVKDSFSHAPSLNISLSNNQPLLSVNTPQESPKISGGF
jgi:ABC-type branched-subunit amino acid transport system ATPase component